MNCAWCGNISEYVIEPLSLTYPGLGLIHTITGSKTQTYKLLNCTTHHCSPLPHLRQAMSPPPPNTWRHGAQGHPIVFSTPSAASGSTMLDTPYDITQWWAKLKQFGQNKMEIKPSKQPFSQLDPSLLSLVPWEHLRRPKGILCTHVLGHTPPRWCVFHHDLYQFRWEHAYWGEFHSPQIHTRQNMSIEQAHHHPFCPSMCTSSMVAARELILLRILFCHLIRSLHPDNYSIGWWHHQSSLWRRLSAWSCS